MAGTDIKGLKIILDLDISNLSDSIVTAKKTINSLQRELDNVNKTMKLDTNAFDDVKVKSQILKEQQTALNSLLEEYQNELNALKADGVTETDVRFRSLTNNIIAVKAKLKEVTEELAKISVYKITKPLEDFSEWAGKCSQACGELARATAAISGISAGILGGATKGAIDYESAMASVKKTVDEVIDANGNMVISYDDISDSIRELSLRVPSSASSIAEVVALAGQLGIATEDVVKFSESMINLGNSTNLSAEEAATTLAKFINVTGSSASDIDKLSSAIVELGNNTATTEADIMNMAFRLSAAGTAVGFSETEILGLAAALSSTGLQAEAAGGSISTVLQTIEKSVQTSLDANEDLATWGELLGVTGEQFKKLWSEDAYGTFQNVVKGLGTVNDESGNLISTLDQLGVSSIRQLDSMTRLALAGDLMAETVDMANSAYSKGTALQDEADKRYETTASQLTILKNNITDLSITLGTYILPVVNKAIEFVTNFINKNKEWIANNAELILKILAFTAALSPAFKIGQKFFGVISSLSGGLAKVIEKVAIFVSKAKLFVSGISHAQLVTAGWIAAIAAVAAGFIYAYKNNDEFREKVNAFAETVKNIVVPVIQDLWSWLKALWESLKSILVPVVQNVVYIFKNVFVPIIIKVSSVVMDLITIVLTLGKKLWDFLYPIISKVSAIIRDVFGAVLIILTSIIDSVIKIVVGLIDKIKDLFFKVNDTAPIKTFGDVLKALVSPINAVKDAISNMTSWLSGAIDKLKSFFGLNAEAQEAYNNTVSQYYSASKSGTPSRTGKSTNTMNSGGLGLNGGLVLTTNINVTNNGTPIDESEIRRWGNTITQIVSDNLGRAY